MTKEQTEWFDRVLALREKYLTDNEEYATPAGKVKKFRNEMDKLLEEKPEELFWDIDVLADFEEWLKTADDDDVFEAAD